MQIREGTLPIKISSTVVRHLSRGLYRNFGRAVKELISNSYDGKATEVKIKLDLDSGRIIVRDNGQGMDLDYLREKFLNIGYSTPLTEKTDELGRKRVGTFGIGCVSVFPYCKKLQVITKKRGKKEVIELNINTEQFFKEGVFFPIEKAKVPYKIYPSDLAEGKGETIIVLEKIRPHIVKELRQKKLQGKSSIDKFGGFQKFKWTIYQYTPITFPPDRKDLRDFFGSFGTPMRLWLDGEELFRNVPENAKILEKGEEQFDGVSLKYVIMTTMKPIEPEEARGAQIRLRNVAIGLPRDFDVTKLTGKVLGKLNYICSEIHILKGLDSALMVDRDSFSYTQEIANIYDFFQKKLIKWNDTLEKWASRDKDIYESLMRLKAPESVVEELKKAGIVRFSKERLRLPKAPMVKRKGISILPLSERIDKVLSEKTDFEIVHKKGKIQKRKPPIKVISKKKSIIVYDDHPLFVETIKVGEKEFRVDYDKWDPNKTPYSICRLGDGKKVIFNTSHPLFKSKLSDGIIKQLSLRIVLILKKEKNKENLLNQLNTLLEEIFLKYS